eukprot:29555-Pleurochrysis_carterae.AAC.2
MAPKQKAHARARAHGQTHAYSTMCLPRDIAHALVYARAPVRVRALGGFQNGRFFGNGVILGHVI